MNASPSVPSPAPRIVAAMMAKDRFSQWLGIEILDAAPGTVRLRMPIRPDMVNGLGVCHGGVTFALADSALAFASNGHGRVAFSVDTSITHSAPVRDGDVLTAHATEEGTTKRLGFYRVTVTNQNGTPVAWFRGTVLRTDTTHEIAPSSRTEQ